VRVRLNEPRHEVLVEVPMPAATREDVLECKQTLAQIEALAAVHSRGHRARGWGPATGGCDRLRQSRGV